MGVGLSHLAMLTGASSRRRDRSAIGGSLALHVCALAALAAIPHLPGLPGEEPDERILLSSLVHVQHPAAPPRRVVRRAAVVPPRSHLPAATPPPLEVAVTTAHSSRALVVPAERRYAPAPPPASVVRHPLPRRVTAPVVVAAAAPPTAPPAASTTPTAAPTATPAPAEREDGIGNFGETYPASLDPQLRGALIAGVAGIDVRVTVDERGRPTAIEFVRAPADPALREELRSRLLAARFIPAACNGLRCSGTVEIRT